MGSRFIGSRALHFILKRERFFLPLSLRGISDCHFRYITENGLSFIGILHFPSFFSTCSLFRYSKPLFPPRASSFSHFRVIARDCEIERESGARAIARCRFAKNAVVDRAELRARVACRIIYACLADRCSARGTRLASDFAETVKARTVISDPLENKSR